MRSSDSSALRNGHRILRGRLPLFPQFCQPSVQDRNTVGVNGSERDPHTRTIPRISNATLSSKNRSVVRDSHSGLRSTGEWSLRLDETTEEIQVFGVSVELSLRVDSGDLNPCDEVMTFPAVTCGVVRQAISLIF